ncbi:MAG: hypothetical protein PHQ43_08700, partial [Dehalococcoidales bacterium]|nr:hypothetical protein [Dehalococcoidales bacterium]
MRTNATLLAEQIKPSYKPYVTLHYYTSGRPSAGAGAWTQFDNLGSRDRIVEIYHAQEPFGSRAVITLDNSASSYDAYDLVGKWIRIGYGAVCSGSNEVSYPPYLICNAQDFISQEGEDKYVVYCEGAWSKLQRWTCGPDDLFFNQAALNATLNDKTIRQIADYILEQAGLDLGADIGTVDDAVDGWKPVFDCMAGMNGFDAIRSLLFYCRSALVPRTDCLHFKYCQDADDVDYTYLSSSTHYFRMSRSRSVYFKPMKVQINDTVNDYTGSYAWGDGGETPAWNSTLGTQLWEDGSGVATSNADCVLLARSIVERAASERETGWIKANMNCLQEIYDKVTVTDNRGNTGGTGRVGGVYCHYKPGGKDPYYIELRLGGLQRTLAGDMQGIVDDMPMAGIKLPGTSLQKHSISPDILRLSTQPSTNDIAWTSTGVANATWAAGTVYFQDGSTLAINSGSKSDLTATHLAYCIEGNSTIQWTTDWQTATAKGCTMLAMCVKGDADSSKALIKVFNGKQDVLSAVLFYADLILGKHIKAGEIDTDHLAANAVTAEKIASRTITFDKLISGYGNLLQNPSFEQGATGWTRDSGSWTID